jgi:tRNA (mo5U34)-methyltransferase
LTNLKSKSAEAIAKARGRKDLAPLFAQIDALTPTTKTIEYGDMLTIKTESGFDNKSAVFTLAKKLMPWRKGPVTIDDIEIDTEWRSFVKYNILAPHFDLKDKKVADIGANNGYYSFRMLEHAPASITIFEPYPLYYAQFAFLDRFFDSHIRFELLGVEDLGSYGEKFDAIFCLGVVYHRTDPISSLKQLKGALEKGGELFVDMLIIERDDELVLAPSESYAKMSNAYFIPSKKAFEGWLTRAGFSHIEFLGQRATDIYEQRKTEWIEGLSLDSWLDSDGKTVEGYERPIRAYYKCKV